MPRNSFIQMSKLTNVRGRITYISSHAKQENLYEVYETTNRNYWTELAKFNQQEFLKSGTEGKCIEARELIIALPESFQDIYLPDKLLQLFTDRFQKKYDVECVSALHHNKRKTNYHVHLIFAERELLPEPIEKIATRNMFYSDSLSAYYQVDYKTPEVIVDFLGNGKKFIDDKIRNMHPDSFNEPFLDRYIDSLIELAKDEINEQRASHERAILDIKMGQITKVQLYKNSIEKCKEEMEQLKLEVSQL